ncbi:hypothetical protein C8Q76DRAFT_823363 [Earliella scabrosa]|nr:hypothetical protein C8Q76DRAFT_823363 [Earliella scabrosa]
MAGKSPSLRTLIVQEASLSVTSTSLGTISIFTRLVTLNLSWVTFANFAACRRFLCAFPELKDLTLWEVRWRYWVPYGAMVYFMGNVPRVVRLSLGLFGMAGELQNVSVTEDSKVALLHMFSASLERLVVYHCPTEAHCLPAFTFSALISVTFHIVFAEGLANIPCFLSNNALPNLRFLHFVDTTFPDAATPDSLPRFPYPSLQLDHAITNARTRMPALEKVVIVYAVKSPILDLEHIASMVLARSHNDFPELSQNGLLVPVMAAFTDVSPPKRAGDRVYTSRIWQETSSGLERFDYSGRWFPDAIQCYLERY